MCSITRASAQTGEVGLKPGGCEHIRNPVIVQVNSDKKKGMKFGYCTISFNSSPLVTCD